MGCTWLRVVRRLPHAAYGLTGTRSTDCSRQSRGAGRGDRARDLTPRTAPATDPANGRTAQAQGGDRLFGFKLSGSCGRHRRVVLFDSLWRERVEGGEINICGLAPERLLRDCAFQPTGCSPAVRRCSHVCRASNEPSTGSRRPLVPGSAPRRPNRCLSGRRRAGFHRPFTNGNPECVLSGHGAGAAAAGPAGR
jgi:hypothetical protein